MIINKRLFSLIAITIMLSNTSLFAEKERPRSRVVTSTIPSGTMQPIPGIPFAVLAPMTLHLITSQNSNLFLDYAHINADQLAQIIRSLPAATRTSIRTLSVAHNTLTSVPQEIALLPNLRVLNISHNQVTQLPEEVGQLHHLINLNASHNALVTIHHNLRHLTHLRRAYFSSNPHLTEIPVFFRTFTAVDLFVDINTAVPANMPGTIFYSLPDTQPHAE